MSNWAHKNMSTFDSFTSSVQCFHHNTYNLKLNNNGKAKVGLIPACAAHQYNSGFLKPELYKVSFAFSIFFVPVCVHFISLNPWAITLNDMKYKKRKKNVRGTNLSWPVVFPCGRWTSTLHSPLLPFRFGAFSQNILFFWSLLTLMSPRTLYGSKCVLHYIHSSCPQRHVSFPLARASAECWGIHCVV